MRVEVAVTGSGWTCGAVLEPALTGEDRESFDFLIALDPLFALRFDEGSMLHVNVAPEEDGGGLTLVAYEAGAAEAGSRRLPD